MDRDEANISKYYWVSQTYKIIGNLKIDADRTRIQNTKENIEKWKLMITIKSDGSAVLPSTNNENLKYVNTAVLPLAYDKTFPNH